MTARITPSTILIAMATTVSRIVSSRLQHPAGQEVAPNEVPLEAGFVTRVCEHRDQHQHNGCGQPPSANRDRLDLLRRIMRPAVCAVRGVVTLLRIRQRAIGPPGGGSANMALIAGLDGAPFTPHLSRIFV